MSGLHRTEDRLPGAQQIIAGFLHAVAEALLAASPAVAEAEDEDRRTPLELGRMSTARCLLPYGPASRVLTALAQAGQPVLPLFADFVIGRPPLTAQEWALVPAPCPGLGRALPAALGHSLGQVQLSLGQV